MKNVKDEIPAWMIAQALVIKMKNVLLEEAIDLLYKEIEAKRMAINGKFMPMDLEHSGEMEQGLFLIRQLMADKERIMHGMSIQIHQMEMEKKPTSEGIEKMESGRKFMLAVEQITSLAEHGIVCEQWFNDVSMEVKEDDPAAILAKTAGGKDTHRADVLKYMVGSKIFKSTDLFTVEEKKTLTSALELC
jgi:hypothetical protein